MLQWIKIQWDANTSKITPPYRFILVLSNLLDTELERLLTFAMYDKTINAIIVFSA